jgi:predicted dehydrogenase
MKRKLGVGIIGTGFGALVHLPAYKLNSHYEIKGIWGRDRVKAEGIARDNAIMSFASVEEMAENNEIDLVSIASIPCLHYSHAMNCIRNLKHIILEKPMAMNSSESETMWRAATHKGIYNAIAHEHRFDPTKQYVKYLIENEVFGKVRAVEIVKHMTYWRDAQSGRGFDWYSDSSLGGGITKAHLSHQIDLIHYWLGSLGRIEGFGLIENPQRYNYDKSRIQIATADDSVYCVILTDSNIPVTVNISAARLRDYSEIRVYTEFAEICVYGPNELQIFDVHSNRVSTEIPTQFHIQDFGLDYRINTFNVLLNKFYAHYIQGHSEDITNFEQGHTIQLWLDKIPTISNYREL